MSVRIKHNSRAYRDLLTSDAAMRDLVARGRRVAAAAGDGHVVEPSLPARKRARVAVIAVSAGARRANSADNVLVRALDAGRG